MKHQEFDAIRKEVKIWKEAGYRCALSLEKSEKLLAEIDRLTAIVDSYALSARTIALYLKPYCDESMSYAEMIADASRNASTAIDQLIDDLRHFPGITPCRYCKNMGSPISYKCKLGDRSCFEWRGLEGRG